MIGPKNREQLSIEPDHYSIGVVTSQNPIHKPYIVPDLDLGRARLGEPYLPLVPSVPGLSLARAKTEPTPILGSICVRPGLDPTRVKSGQYPPPTVPGVPGPSSTKAKPGTNNHIFLLDQYPTRAKTEPTPTLDSICVRPDQDPAG